MNATINQTIIHLGNANEYILGSNEFWESMDTIFFIGMPSSCPRADHSRVKKKSHCFWKQEQGRIC